jgi:KDO2-lipid IV(A) lauroyltransferase
MTNNDFSMPPVTIWGRIMYRLIPLRKKIILNNINLVFKERISLREKNRFVKAIYSHIFSVIKDVILLGWLSKNRLKQRVQTQGVEHLENALSQGNGVILLTGHLGSWELAVFAGLHGLELFAGKCHIIRKPIRKKWLEKMVFRRFDQWGIKRISSIDAPKKIIRILKNKEIVVYFFDQHACIQSNAGLAVDFFNVKAGTYRSLAFFAQKLQCSVVPLACFREKNEKHVIKFYPALTWEEHPDKEQALINNTLIYNQTLEQMILAHPEQWWWVHRRWKLE